MIVIGQVALQLGNQLRVYALLFLAPKQFHGRQRNNQLLLDQAQGCYSEYPDLDAYFLCKFNIASDPSIYIAIWYQSGLYLYGESSSGVNIEIDKPKFFK